jgi:N-acetylglucosaminyldiphosphoundecaprenol N-acetyl-beta-D-mannosaminyltransferase
MELIGFEMNNEIFNILGMKVNKTSCKMSADVILGWTEKCKGRYVCVSNVHMCMEVFDDSSFMQIVNSADMVVPDGRPLVWAQRLMGAKKPKQVRGADLLLNVCELAEMKGIGIGLYGGTTDSLNDFLIFLKRKFPRLKIDYHYSPPFRDLTIPEDLQCVEAIRNSGVKILFVGIGCPKQENWMADHKGRIECVMIGVGAVFDFFSGRQKHAPRILQVLGLEWLFRLINEPGRLWRRYLFHNPRFVFYFMKQMFGV